MTQPPLIFISYSHRDEKWKDKLAVQLDVLAKESRLSAWDDRRIAAGDDWFAEIKQAIAAAEVAVLLISAHFLTSAFVRREEIPRFLARRQSEGLRIVPILIRPCPWRKVAWLAPIQMRPTDGREIARGNAYKIDRDFASIAEEIDDLMGGSAAPSSSAKTGSASSTIDLSALPPSGPYFFGREAELGQLGQAWTTPSTNIISLVAWGGAGKSALVNHWLGNMAVENFRGAERVYGWSFYSQGTKETETSADEFFKAALTWFGDREPEKGSPWQKGERLAGLIQKQQTLLVLDGLEPLQNPPGVEGGKLKDPALAELIRHLEFHNPGLCLITTRLEVADIADRRHATAPVIDLGRLSNTAGCDLLEAIGVRGEPGELAEAVDAVDGHALTLNLLGTYVRDILDRDVRCWHEAGLLESARYGDQRALQVMAAYETWFAGRPELAILRILGLFDRPARRELVDVLRKPPLITGLNDELVDLPEKELHWALARLRQARLVEDETGGAIDAHPLVREHFGERLKTEQPEAWRMGHGRLYEHLKKSAKPLPDTLAEMAPLFQAVHHGCQAARYQETMDDVYYDRIQRDGGTNYCMAMLGAVGADLAAVSSFFDPPWVRLAESLREEDKAFLLNAAGFRFRALGRLREAVAPLRAAVGWAVGEQKWLPAATAANNLLELQLSLGELAEAVGIGEAGVEYADWSGDAPQRIINRASWADALHHAGETKHAKALFEEAEALQAEIQPDYPRLYSVQGYMCCDLLLGQGRAADVRERALYALGIAQRHRLNLLTIALGHLSLGRAALPLGKPAEARVQLDRAAEGLRQAGQQDYLARGFVARAALFRETGEFAAARRDLDEAMRIAKRSEMRLFQCDAHLEYARLALAEGNRDKAREHVTEARRLVDETGYGRRRPEVEELESQLVD